VSTNHYVGQMLDNVFQQSDKGMAVSTNHYVGQMLVGQKVFDQTARNLLHLGRPTVKVRHG